MCQNNKNAKYKEEKNIRKTYLKKKLEKYNFATITVRNMAKFIIMLFVFGKHLFFLV
jgi:hypothetical protein